MQESILYSADRDATDLHLHVNSSGLISLLTRGARPSSPGEPSGELELPPWLFDAIRQLTPPPPWVDRRFVPDRDLLLLVGSTLFDALFPGRVGAHFAELRRGHHLQLQHLRVRLTFKDPLHEAIPWELCRDPSGRWLGAESNLTFARRLPGGEALPGLHSRPLRILVLTAVPKDLPLLAVQRELDGIGTALGSLQEKGLVQLTVCRQVQFEDLQSLLPAIPSRAAVQAEQGFHIVHFIGHGLWDPEKRRGFLAFVNPQGQHELIEEDALALLLQRHTACRLVVLNACQTANGEGLDLLEKARMTPQRHAEPEATSSPGLSGEDWVARVHGKGVALSLLRHGVPAVVANQHPVRDDLAERFSQHFYQHLFRGFSIEEAIQGARRVLLETLTHREPGNLAFATPVLFLQAARAERFILPGQADPASREAHQ